MVALLFLSARFGDIMMLLYLFGVILVSIFWITFIYLTFYYSFTATICLQGPNAIRRIDGRFGSEQYISFIDDCIVKQLVPDSPPRNYVHDHFPVHTCRAVYDWFANREDIKLFSIPPKSPELMPLRHVFPEIAARINSNRIFPNSPDELWDTVAREFNIVSSPSFIEPFINEIPSNLLSFCNNGGH